MSNYVYKVVYVINDRMYSVSKFFTRGLEDQFVLKYKIGEVTKPKIENSAIYAFEDLSTAQTFAIGVIPFAIGVIRGGVILKCLYARSYAPAIIENTICDHKIIKMWKDIDQIKDIGIYDYSTIIGGMLISKAPIGTVMCEWVKPIEMVKRW